MYEVIVVRYGSRDTVRSDVFLNYHFYGEPDGPITVDYFFWVLRGAEQTFVVDVGFSPEAGRRRGRVLHLHPVDALRDLGVDPAADLQVIVTHGHYDHVGNLSLLPRATLLMSRREYEFWTSELAGRPLFRYFAEPADIEQLRTARQQDRMRFVAHGDHPAPGITVLEVGGHTPGQLALLVETNSGPALLASDAVHFYEELDRDMPFVAVSDLPAMYGGFDTIRGLLAAQPHHLVPGHDSATLSRFPPLAGPLTGHAAVIGALPGVAVDRPDR